MNRVKIVSRWDSKVLFECEIPEGIGTGMTVRYALEKAVASDADLRGADLRDANLRGANLRGANLSDANLSGADLRDANLSGADLRDANLIGAYLIGANLSGADLRDANLSGADLSGANLIGAYLIGAYLSGADLSGANLIGAYLRGADLSGANLIGAASPAEAVANLDKVREIILDNAVRLDMGHWHGDEEWKDRSCAEEALCGTTHCLAGWLQVCSTDPKVRGMKSVYMAGLLMAPVAAPMFYAGSDEALTWLRDRKYAEEA